MNAVVRKRLGLSMLTASLALLTLVPLAHAEFDISGLDGEILRQDGSAASQAGSHPYDISTTISFNSHEDPVTGFQIPDADAKNVAVDLPPGMVGNPTATPARCEIVDMIVKACPLSSQVGIANVNGNVIGPIYNMVTPAGVSAEFGFLVENSPVLLLASVRNGADYGVTVSSLDTSQAGLVLFSTVTFWGTPADPSHDFQRCALPDTSVDPPACTGWTNDDRSNPHSLGPPLVPFLRNSTSCTAPGVGLEFDGSADSWQNPGVFVHSSFHTHQPGEPENQIGTTGCDMVPFEPSISVQPTSHEADSPTGLDVSLSVPQDENPDGIASSDLKRAVVTLPQGMTVNPSSASGLGSCSNADYEREAVNSAPGEGCPLDSKIGSVKVDTPLLEDPLKGSVYLAEQGENQFGSLLAIYVVVKSPERGVIVKLAGHVVSGADGQLTTSFDDNPQLPFSSFDLSFFSGPRASLITPPTCGIKTTEASLYPWARPDEPVALTSSFQITSGPRGSACPSDPAGFDPELDAGVTNPVAGAHSPFVVKLTREDATQRFASLDISPPPGLLASLRGVPYCPQGALDAISPALGTGAAQLAAPSCPAASQLGTVEVAAGAGAIPFVVPTGRAYLAGPYRGAPLSLAIVTPALAGPFDLGSVLIRTALHVDPETARITAVSDPIPTIVQGISLDLRDLHVNLDRPGFTLNPTSCDAMSVGGTVSGSEGASANVSDRFQVGECGALPFKPKLKLSLKGATHRRAHPSLHATLTAKPGEANIARAQVKLPKAAFLDNSHIGAVCTRVQFAAHSCPPDSVYGYAKAVTPLLDSPLQGPVYLRSSSHPLPDLVADLGGQIEVTLAGKTDSVKGALRNTFEAVPDAPVTKFSLTLYGGKRGLIELSSGFCAHPKATVKLDGQNGKVRDFKPVVKADCGVRHERNKGKKHQHRAKSGTVHP